MKKIAIMFSLLLMLSISINAETFNNSTEKNTKVSAETNQELNLSEGQKQQIVKIYEKYSAEVNALQDKNISDKQKQDAFNDIMLRSKNEIAKILTPEQMKMLNNQA
ncbi:MAG: hypothetical protein KBF12_12610 [Sebaldella sp.]|nr:hypothetical protein [Sebaldella sp.]